MPDIPQEQRQVGPAALPGVRMSSVPNANTYGANIARVGEDTGLAIYQKEVEEANQTQFLDGATQLEGIKNDLLTQARQVKGKDAMGAMDAALESWDKQAGELIDEGGYNSTVKQALGRARLQHAKELMTGLQQHAATQREAYKDDVTDQALVSSQNSIRNLITPDVPMASLKGSLATIELNQDAIVADVAKRKGLEGTELHDVIRKNARSSNGAEVVKGLLAVGRDQDAKQFFLDRKKAGDFTAVHLDQLEHAVMEGSSQGEAARTVNGWIQSGMPADEMQAKVRTMREANPKAADYAHNLVNQHLAEQTAQAKAQNNQMMMDGMALIDQKPGRQPWQLMTPAAWASMSKEQRSALQDYANDKLKPMDRVNNDAKQLQFFGLSTDQRGNLSEAEFRTQYWRHFDNHMRDRSMEMWRESRQSVLNGQNKTPKDPKDPQVTDAQPVTDQIMDTLKLSGLLKDSTHPTKDEQDVQVAARFQRQATAALEQESVKQGRKLTATERQAVIDTVKNESMKKLWVPGFFWNSEKPVIQMTDEEKAKAFVPLAKIPDAQQIQLKRLLDAKGRKVTPDKLERLYTQMLMKNDTGVNTILSEP